METLEEFYEVFRTLVSLSSGVDSDSVILSDQGRSAPTSLYVTYKPHPIRAVGHPRRIREDVAAVGSSIPEWTDLNETVASQLDLMIACNFFNEGSDVSSDNEARNAAWRMHNANFRNSVHEYLYSNNLGWRYCSDIRDLSNLLQAGIQPRYQVDVLLYAEVEVSEVVLRAAGFNLVVVDYEDNEI